MNDFIPQKIGMGFAFGAFGFLAFGSLLAGATFVTSVIRGFQAALAFGGIAWWLGWYLLKNEIAQLDDAHEEEIPQEKIKPENHDRQF